MINWKIKIRSGFNSHERFFVLNQGVRVLNLIHISTYYLTKRYDAHDEHDEASHGSGRQRLLPSSSGFLTTKADEHEQQAEKQEIVAVGDLRCILSQSRYICPQ